MVPAWFVVKAWMCQKNISFLSHVEDCERTSVLHPRHPLARDCVFIAHASNLPLRQRARLVSSSERNDSDTANCLKNCKTQKPQQAWSPLAGPCSCIHPWTNSSRDILSADSAASCKYLESSKKMGSEVASHLSPGCWVVSLFELLFGFAFLLLFPTCQVGFRFYESHIPASTSSSRSQWLPDLNRELQSSVGTHARDCQRECQTECQIECQNMSDRRSEHMADGMPDR